jgi:guanyl-specific ribonuclease Sa
MRRTPTKVEHVVETDAAGNQRIGARRVVDAGDPPTGPREERADKTGLGERAQLNGR